MGSFALELHFYPQNPFGLMGNRKIRRFASNHKISTHPLVNLIFGTVKTAQFFVCDNLQTEWVAHFVYYFCKNFYQHCQICFHIERTHAV